MPGLPVHHQLPELAQTLKINLHNKLIQLFTKFNKHDSLYFLNMVKKIILIYTSEQIQTVLYK